MILIDELDDDIKRDIKVRPAIRIAKPKPAPTYPEANHSLANIKSNYDTELNSYNDRNKTHSRLPSSSSALSFFEPSLSTSHDLAPRHSKASNYLLIQRENASIRGAYVINPGLTIPSFFLPKLPLGEIRRNIILLTRNGHVHCDVWIDEQLELRRTLSGDSPFTQAGSDEDFGIRLLREAEMKERNTRVDVKAQSDNGYILLKLHTPPHRRLNISVIAKNGSAYVFLPQTFSGPIYINSDGGGVYYSSGIEGLVRQLPEGKSNNTYFVGDLSFWRNVGWDGDELRIESRNGNIFIAYIDEPESNIPRGTRFLGKLLSLAK